MIKKILIGLVLIAAAVAIYFVINSSSELGAPVYTNDNGSEPVTFDEKPPVSNFSVKIPSGARSLVDEGDYVVLPAESTLTWSGKKPLIDGYINTGSIAIKSGQIKSGENEAAGSFTIDMNSLSVSGTPKKPGEENALEKDLKSDKWFDVEQFKEAEFTIVSIVPVSPESEERYLYDVTGTLTMKGVTGELEFPATIYMDDLGQLRAEASLEFDRTKWGITAGSGSFFDNLADNAIDDMVALEFSIVAEGV